MADGQPRIDLTEEEDVKPSFWDWTKFIFWFAFSSIFVFLILPHTAFNLLTDFCGDGLESCSPEETVDWLISTTLGKVALVVLGGVVVWLYGPIVKWLLSYFTESGETESRSFVALVFVIVLLPLALSVMLFVQLFQPVYRIEEPAQATIVQEIVERYHRYSREFDVLARQLEEDREILELHCDPRLVYVSTPEGTFYYGENDRYTNKYKPICQFGRQVGAERSERGLRFPHRFTDFGELFVVSNLEWRRSSTGVLDECVPDLFEGEHGACEVIINGNWSAAFYWEPFCQEGMGYAEGC